MKTKLALTLALFGLASSAASAQSLLLKYDFSNVVGATVNDTSGNSRNASIIGSGSLGASGSGVSGAAGDYAFNNTLGTMSSTGGGGVQLAPAIGSLTSFTISMWYKTDGSQSVTQGTRFLDNPSLLLALGTNTGNITFNSGSTVLVTNGATGTAATSTILSQNQWVFVAVTYDGTISTNNVNLYIGTTSTNASLIAQGSVTAAPLSIAGNLTFGNNIGLTRSMDGFLDDIRVYGETSGAVGAMTLAQIQAVQASASSIPEPGTYAALAGAFALGLGIWRRRVS